MKFILSFVLVCFVSTSLADVMKSKINSIDEGKNSDSHVIKLENGRVVFLDDDKKIELQSFKDSLINRDLLEIKVDERNSLEEFRIIHEGIFENLEEGSFSYPERMSYEPSIVSSQEALDIFKRMRRDYQNDSQCYNRAHIWAYEEFNKSLLNSVKLFLFFTNSYIRRYRYHWWFHVSPLVLVRSGNQITEKVLDRRYTRSPLDLKTWTDIFIYSKRACPKVSRYNDYRSNQENEHCYLIPVSMYFWQPRDILRRDETGYVKEKYFTSEINWSYYEAF